MIVFEAPPFYVCTEKFGKTNGYAVYKNGHVAAIRVAQIGYDGQKGISKAIAEATRRLEIHHCAVVRE